VNRCLTEYLAGHDDLRAGEHSALPGEPDPLSDTA
jgi:hypothetical protein